MTGRSDALAYDRPEVEASNTKQKIVGVRIGHPKRNLQASAARNRNATVYGESSQSTRTTPKSMSPAAHRTNAQGASAVLAVCVLSRLFFINRRNGPNAACVLSERLRTPSERSVLFREEAESATTAVDEPGARPAQTTEHRAAWERRVQLNSSRGVVKPSGE
eukprot:6214269-Pleurochrysis_carterae.AAC.4